jgi:hypothetical protein
MNLAESVQRRILQLVPVPLLNRWCWSRPRFVIELLCHCLNEKNIVVEERGLAMRKPAFPPVAKKMSQLDTVSILNLLRQDENLWRLYMAGVGIRPFPSLPYILLQLIYDLGGSEGRKKVKDIVERCRLTLGGRTQGYILENFKTETVIEILEGLPEFEVTMRLSLSRAEAVALWLDQWDLKMRRIGKPPVSPEWIGRLTGERAFQIIDLMKRLEFRRERI